MHVHNLFTRSKTVVEIERMLYFLEKVCYTNSMCKSSWKGMKL